MSVIAVGGRTYAAGLYWLERRGARATARSARRLARPWCVHHGERTGFVGACTGDGSPEGPRHETRGPEDVGPSGREPEGFGPSGREPEGLDPAGLAALALALLAHLGDGFWMALLEGEAPGGGAARYALVKARGGAVLADGDEVFDDRAAALAAFERARGLGWALHSTPGLRGSLENSGPEVAVLDPAALGDAAERAGAAIALTRALPASGGQLKPLHAALAAAAIAAAVGLWLGRDALLGLVEQVELPAVPVAEAPDPEVAVAVDGAALAAACRRALAQRPPFLPGWEIEGIACSARFGDAELTALRPELAGKPVLLVRWGLAAGHAEAIARRLAERHLSGWHAGAVVQGRAWAAAPLGPVLRVVDTPVPPFLALREAVDRAFGAGGARLGYVRGAGRRQRRRRRGRRRRRRRRLLPHHRGDRAAQRGRPRADADGAPRLPRRLHDADCRTAGAGGGVLRDRARDPRGLAPIVVGAVALVGTRLCRHQKRRGDQTGHDRPTGGNAAQDPAGLEPAVVGPDAPHWPPPTTSRNSTPSPLRAPLPSSTLRRRGSKPRPGRRRAGTV